MPVSFDNLTIGNEYDRPYLAELWGYKGFQAISRGVVTPAGSNTIILFVTKEKQQALTQYNDYIDGDFIHWEGEEKHSSDQRIINSRTSDDRIYLFYREIHHTPFIFYGEVELISYILHENEPSKFIYSLSNSARSTDAISDIDNHIDELKALSNTEKEAVVKSRVGQGQFRESLIQLWGSCSVTGLPNLSLLKASHIKPWRDSSNKERLDPMNGLLLQPTLDHLFDRGLITFSENGTLKLSARLSTEDVAKLSLPTDMKLKRLIPEVMYYLAYHREKVFR